MLQLKFFTTVQKIALLPCLGVLLAPFTELQGKRQAADLKITGKRPNIIIVLSDDQGYGDLSCHGNPILKTSNMDRFHDESIRLTDFHVAAISTPTRSQLLTGVDNLRNRACQWGYGIEFIRHDIPTIADIFSLAGYYTGQFGKWHLGDMFPHRPSDRGFRESVRFGGAAIQQTPDHWDSDGFDDFYWHNDIWKQYKGYCTDIFFDEAMRFMRECQKEGKPFLTYLATPAVHDPCFVDGKYRKPYMSMKFNDKPLPPNVLSYFGMLTNLDENMGRLDEFLIKQGLKENTIVIFMSDNGGVQGIPIYDAGMSGTKGSLLEGGHRQFCFIRWPAGSLHTAGDISGLTEIQDILPTLLELCGIKKPQSASFDGISLAPLLHGQPQDLHDRMLVVQWGWGGKGSASVLWQRWRLCGSPNGSPMQTPVWQLNNLDSDPYQKNNVLARYPEVAEKMLNYYEAWWKELEPALKLHECPHVGDPRANPVTLTSYDYIDHKLLEKRYGNVLKVYGGSYNLCLQSYIRNGMAVHGKWLLYAVSAGKYRIILRRWPAEANTAITEGLPLQKLTDTYPENGDRNFWWGTPQVGVALPIVRAKARFDNEEQTASVGPKDKTVEFDFSLSTPGEVELETWFFDAQDNEICSSYYADIRKLEDIKK